MPGIKIQTIARVPWEDGELEHTGQMGRHYTSTGSMPHAAAAAPVNETAAALQAGQLSIAHRGFRHLDLLRH
jgi:hypothetical protein